MQNIECGIYSITNILNGKMYIGKSKNILHRIYNHKYSLKSGSHINKHLQNSWDKNGEKSFEFNVIEICDIETLNDREKFFIEKFNTYLNGYNGTIGGDGSSGVPLSEATKLKLSISMSGRKLTPEQAHIRRGSFNGMSRFTNTNILEIKNLIYLGLKNIDISIIYGCPKSTIEKIRYGSSWKHIIFNF